ncbi:hypothetical protein [Streptomyces sp.]|nr:hypothetical protein [Streptomyces sp.]
MVVTGVDRQRRTVGLSRRRAAS